MWRETVPNPDRSPVAIPIATGPCPTAAERAYLLDLDKRLIGIGNASTDLQTSLSHPGLPADPEAKTVVLIWTASILLLAEEILLLEHPTGRLSAIDQAATRLARSWKAALEALLEYLERQDEAASREALDHVDRALTVARNLSRLADEFCA